MKKRTIVEDLLVFPEPKKDPPGTTAWIMRNRSGDWEPIDPIEGYKEIIKEANAKY